MSFENVTPPAAGCAEGKSRSEERQTAVGHDASGRMKTADSHGSVGQTERVRRASARASHGTERRRSGAQSVWGSEGRSPSVNK